MFCPETNYLQRYQFFGTVFLAQISDKFKKIPNSIYLYLQYSISENATRDVACKIFNRSIYTSTFIPKSLKRSLPERKGSLAESSEVQLPSSPKSISIPFHENASQATNLDLSEENVKIRITRTVTREEQQDREKDIS
jgi:hypothetical protein